MIDNNNKINREKLLSILTVALEHGNYKFVLQAANNWLEQYPGDLGIQLFQAVHAQCVGEVDEAREKFRELIAIDPTFLSVYLAIADIYTDDENVWGYLYVLSGEMVEEHRIPKWAKTTRKMYALCQEGDIVEAEKFLPLFVNDAGRNVLVDLIHLLHVHRTQSIEVVKTLASLYHQRWPLCLQIKLILADAMMKTGEEIEALKIISACAEIDQVGQTTQWIWPAGNPYQGIWPVIEELENFIPIPASIASVFGWNLLQQGEIKESLTQKEFQHLIKGPVSQEVNEAKKIFERLAENLNVKKDRQIDGRYPIYVVMSSKQNLVKKYGVDSANVIIAQMQRLVESVQQKRQWGAMLYLPDDDELMSEIGLAALPVIDPWGLKLGLQDLDIHLDSKGAMIGALLIVGGNEVVPFHALPNPTDDVDDVIYSDNPYGCMDANYFVPDWPVGRLPGEKGNDTGLLMLQLRRILKDHQSQEKKEKTVSGTMAFPFEMLLAFFQQLFQLNKRNQVGESIGYTASIWKRASIGVYRPIGASNLMAVSPPVVAENVDTVSICDAELAYYNLHGIIDGEEWFGQKSYNDTWTGSDFPIALKPSDLIQKGKHQQIIVSEACYGGYVMGKMIEDSLALKFLSHEAKGFIGSTAIAYGSIQPPLIGADLLAHKFWTLLVDGNTVGESLLKAKHQLAEEMNKRQTYLDAEDQKTLLSFVLYGDPLAQYQTADNASEQKGFQREEQTDDLYLLTEKDGELVSEDEFTAHTLSDIKAALETYLPGLELADCTIQQQFLLGEDSVLAKLSANPPETLSREANGNYIVSFKQKFSQYREKHQFFTKVTVDKTGKMLKISMSR
jgi:tetratricopeptide (TPR) repeat protein